MYRQPPTPTTVTEALKKMERYCAYQERCHKEVETKLASMRLIPAAKEKIILHLLQHNFLNEERFAKSFARGKFSIKKWGKIRITRELKSRNISAFNIKSGLKEISESDYIATFHELAEKKFNALTTTEDSYKKRKKLIDYLAYRGWEHHLIFEKIHELFEA